MSLAPDELESGARCGALPAMPLRRGLALDNTLALASRPWTQLVRCGTVASLMQTRLAQGIAAFKLGDGMIAVLTLWLAALLEQTCILPFSSRERRGFGVATPEALARDFCLGLHICFDKGDLGSQGTWLATREAEGCWQNSASGFCFETLVVETFPMLPCSKH